MVNFKSKNVIFFGLGLLLSINSFGFNKGDKGNSGSKSSIIGLGAPTKQVIEEKSSSIEQDIKVNLDWLFDFGLKEASGVVTCTNKVLDDFFKREDVVKELKKIVFYSESNDNILFYVLKNAIKDKHLYLKYFIDIIKKSGDKESLSLLINKTISFKDNSKDVTHSLFTFASKSFIVANKEFEIVANAILDCSDALDIKTLKLNGEGKNSFFDFVLGLSDAAKKQDYLAKIFRIKDVLDNEINLRIGEDSFKEKNLLFHLIHEREFELVKNILEKFEKTEFDKIKNKDLLLHQIISSIGYKNPTNRKEQKVNAGLKLIEFLLKETRVNVNFKNTYEKSRTPLLVLSRGLEGSIEHKNNPRRILTEDVIKVLNILLENRAYLSLEDSTYNKNFIEWLIKDVLENANLRESRIKILEFVLMRDKLFFNNTYSALNKECIVRNINSVFARNFLSKDLKNKILKISEYKGHCFKEIEKIKDSSGGN